MNEKMYKIFTTDEWHTFQSTKVFAGSAMDQQDGFIHLSFESQYSAIQEKFFANQKIVRVGIDATKLNTEKLKVEANRPGGNQYPHYYDVLTWDMLMLPAVDAD